MRRKRRVMLLFPHSLRSSGLCAPSLGRELATHMKLVSPRKNRKASVGKGETMPVTKPGNCRGNKPTKALINCLQPDRRVDVEVTATK